MPVSTRTDTQNSGYPKDTDDLIDDVDGTEDEGGGWDILSEMEIDAWVMIIEIRTLKTRLKR